MPRLDWSDSKASQETSVSNSFVTFQRESESPGASNAASS